jgi:membrane associated rhomboid family serine protease
MTGKIKIKLFEFGTLVAGMLMVYVGCGCIWLDFGEQNTLAGVSGFLFYLLGVILLIGFGATEWSLEKKKPSSGEG